jgi:RNA polymerase sigma factor (sigma-70 family)
VLLILEGLSNKEISEILGISENNVAVRLLRAKKRLATYL